MENPFVFTLDNKRYHTWNYHMKQVFGRKMMKIPINAGFTCPNIDGSRGRGGCVYCSPSGSGEFAGDPARNTAGQFQAVRERMAGKWPGAGCIAYFQAHSNTYGPVERIRAAFEPVLRLPEVRGISVATRADCLPEEVVDYLAEINRNTWLLVELGLQTVHDETARRINRCHDYQTFLQGFQALRQRGIRTCVHLIDGLPGETREMMLETAGRVGRLQPHSVKIHMLHVLEHTGLAQWYRNGSLPLLTREEYVDIVCDQLELMPPEVVIQRLTGDGRSEDLLAPHWTRKKTIVLNEIDKELVRRGGYQGRRCAGSR